MMYSLCVGIFLYAEQCNEMHY